MCPKLCVTSCVENMKWIIYFWLRWFLIFDLHNGDMYIYIYVDIRIHIFVTYIYIYIYMFVHFTHVYTHTHIYMYIVWVCTYVWDVFICIYIYTSIYVSSFYVYLNVSPFYVYLNVYMNKSKIGNPHRGRRGNPRVRDSCPKIFLANKWLFIEICRVCT